MEKRKKGGVRQGKTNEVAEHGVTVLRERKASNNFHGSVNLLCGNSFFQDFRPYES